MQYKYKNDRVAWFKGAFVFLTLFLAFDISILIAQGQIKQPQQPMRKVNPEGWFTLKVPVGMSFTTPADIDGGAYYSSSMDVNFSYWGKENRPNYLSHLKTDELPSGCAKDWKGYRNEWALIDGKKVRVESCQLERDPSGYQFIHYAVFPNVPVYNGNKVILGTFEFYVRHQKPDQSAQAKEILNSIHFFNIMSPR